MPFEFKVAITTALGSIVQESFRANSVQQFSDNMPDEVTIYETTLVRTSEDNTPVDDSEVFLELNSMVGNLKEAAEMTTGAVAVEHAKQLRDISNLTVVIR